MLECIVISRVHCCCCYCCLGCLGCLGLFGSCVGFCCLVFIALVLKGMGMISLKAFVYEEVQIQLPFTLLSL